MTFSRYEFDWDPAKAARNLTKHRISFDQAMTVFLDPLSLSRLDDEHGSDEERWVTIGLSRDTGLIVVVHTYVEIGEDRAYIRIISARRPTKNEQRQYEEAPGQG
ncbi:MAG: BrnT family toxin [Rhodomicrobium sp.]